MGKTNKDRHDWDDNYESAGRKSKRFKGPRRNRKRDLREYKNVPAREIIRDIVDEDD